MSTHYGRMIHQDDRTIMFANPEDAEGPAPKGGKRPAAGKAGGEAAAGGGEAGKKVVSLDQFRKK